MSLTEKQATVRKLRSNLAHKREEEFYIRQQSEESLREIADLLGMIKERRLPTSMSYAPAFLEWALWRLMLAINHIRGPISKTRGFKVDEDIVPIHHAAAGAADCEFEYDDFVLVVEGTLTTSGRQVATEGEPVRRHVADAIHRHPDKPVICLFVAPAIDRNTYSEFFDGRYLIDDDTEYSTNIVPLTIDEVIALIQAMVESKRILTLGEFKGLLESILDARQEFSNGLQWGKDLSASFKDRVSTAMDHALKLSAPS